MRKLPRITPRPALLLRELPRHRRRGGAGDELAQIFTIVIFSLAAVAVGTVAALRFTIR